LYTVCLQQMKHGENQENIITDTYTCIQKMFI